MKPTDNFKILESDWAAVDFFNVTKNVVKNVFPMIKVTTLNTKHDQSYVITLIYTPGCPLSLQKKWQTYLDHYVPYKLKILRNFSLNFEFIEYVIRQKKLIDKSFDELHIR